MASSPSKKRKRGTENDSVLEPESPPPSESESSNPLADPSKTSKDEAAPATADRISFLPHCVLGAIISLVPLKEALRTSVLSSRWRYFWTFAPLHINMGVEDLELSKASDKKRMLQSCLDTVTFILSHHRGPISSFRLSRLLWRYLEESCQLDRTVDCWAQNLARIGIRELSILCKFPPQLLACESLCSLELECDHPEQITALPLNLRELKLGPSYVCVEMEDISKLPPAFLTCQSLHSLELRSYTLEKPLEVTLPRSLRELKLRATKLKQCVLSQFLSGCPLLDRLSLIKSCTLPGDLCICSPSLRKLTVGEFCLYDDANQVIVDAPNIELLMLTERLTKDMNVKVLGASKLRVLGVLGFSRWHVCRLQFGDADAFQVGNITSSYFRLYSLKTLAIQVDLDETRQADTLARLLKCSPSLENLRIVFAASGRLSNPLDEAYWENETTSDCLDRHLKMVTIVGFLNRPSHLGLVRYLGRNARVLKEISLLCGSKVQQSWEETLKHDILQNKASSELQVILESRI